MQGPYTPQPYQPPPPPSDYQPPPNYQPPPPYRQFPPGDGPVPIHRRSGWLVWFVYLGIIIGGTFITMAMYDEAMYGGECYTEYDYWGSYEYCEPDYDMMNTATMVNFGTSLAAMIIYIWWTYSMYQEFNIFMQREVLNPLLAACIPIFNIYAFYTYCEHLNREAALRGRPAFIDPTLTCCLIFIIGIGLPIYQNKLNEFWDMVTYQRHH